MSLHHFRGGKQGELLLSISLQLAVLSPLLAARQGPKDRLAWCGGIDIFSPLNDDLCLPSGPDSFLCLCPLKVRSSAARASRAPASALRICALLRLRIHNQISAP